MQIRIRESGQVMFENEFRAQHPNTSFPPQLSESLLNEFGADVILEGPQATGGDVYQYSQRNGVEQVDGKWYTKYVLGPIFTDGETTAAEQEATYKTRKDNEQAASVRNQRSELLSKCDWTQVADVPVDKTLWAVYRQALRDIPAQTGFPWNVQWPTNPE
jgi:hypothetical protein